MPLSHGSTAECACDICGTAFRQPASRVGRVVTCSEKCKVKRRELKSATLRLGVPTDLPDRTPPSAVGRSTKRVRSDCVICGDGFYIDPKFKERTVTCSKKCSTAKRSTLKGPRGRGSNGGAWSKHRECEWCGVTFRAPNYKARFCSNLCRLEALNALPRVVKPIEDRARSLTAKGYIRIAIPGRGLMLEHRWRMEQSIGRHLTRTEVVHHKNGIRHDNRIGNLQLFASHSDHLKHHAAELKEVG